MSQEKGKCSATDYKERYSRRDVEREFEEVKQMISRNRDMFNEQNSEAALYAIDVMRTRIISASYDKRQDSDECEVGRKDVIIRLVWDESSII